jgi:hypothetical protein
MPQNPENPEFPEDYQDEQSPVVLEAEDDKREIANHEMDDYEVLRERRAMGAAGAAGGADDGDAEEQSREVTLDEDEYRGD